MRLIHLFDGQTWYSDQGVWVYGEREAAGYAEGEGTLEGPRIRGRLRWSNHPVRREDGIWLTDIRGFVRTEDGAEALVFMTGRSLPEAAPGLSRDVVCAATFRSSDPRYRWLEEAVAVVEARFDPVNGHMRLRAHTLENDLA